MAIEVKLPKLGQTMEDGTIVKFCVEIGDKVEKGDVVFDIETDKASVEVESDGDGFVKLILGEVGQTILVGETILVLGDENETIDDSLAKVPKTADADISADRQAAAGADELAKSAAAEKPLDKLRLGDVVAVSNFQRITAQRMLNSKQQKPCFYLNAKADVTGIVELREKLNRQSDVEVSYNDLIIHAVGQALEKFPIMTGHLTNGNIRLPDHINIGLAVSVPNGLVVPVLKDVNKKDLLQISSDRKALIEKANDHKLLPANLEGACITISNLGSFGVESFIPIVVPGQCSILGIGEIIDTCVPANGEVAIRKLMSITITVDHKIANGADGAQFLDFVRKTLEDPSNFQ